MNFQNKEGWLFVMPLMLWLAFSICIPLYIAIELSFFDIKIIGTEGKFVGFKNYVKSISSSKFPKVLTNSVLWVLANAVTQTFFAFIIALTLNKNFKGVKIATNWIILSFIIPTVVIVVIWKLMLSSSSGLVNSLLIQFHLIEKPIGFFSSSKSAFISLVLINSWRWSPFLALIILSGLKSINQEIYDASKIDGTNFFSELFYVTLPQLKGVLFVLGLVGTLLSFNVFDIIWLITKGGPSSATTTLPLLIYETAFTKFRLSQAAALSVITSIILLTFSIVFIKVMGKDHDD
jgi:multiple sugar transport system permease protein